MALPIKIPLSGLAAKKAAFSSSAPLAESKPAPKTPSSPKEAIDRIGIIFDDSASMIANNKLEDAKEGVVEFLRSCNPETTAVGVYTLNYKGLPLSIDLPSLALQVKDLRAIGSTPILSKLRAMLGCKLSRVVLFSDGEPTDIRYEYASYVNRDVKDLCIQYKEKKLVIDTVYIVDLHHPNMEARNFLIYLAEATGGVFLEFEAGKSSFRNSFKYLAPAYRALLADKSFVDKIQAGE